MTSHTETPIQWFELDPTKADLGATEGAFHNGHAMLALPDGMSFVIVGQMTCGTRESAERYVRTCSPHDRDRHITRATLESWRLQPKA